jgi:hypothetical protein
MFLGDVLLRRRFVKETFREGDVLLRDRCGDRRFVEVLYGHHYIVITVFLRNFSAH